MRIKIGPDGVTLIESSGQVFIPRDTEATFLIMVDGRYSVTVGEDVEPPIGPTVRLWT